MATETRAAEKLADRALALIGVKKAPERERRTLPGATPEDRMAARAVNAGRLAGGLEPLPVEDPPPLAPDPPAAAPPVPSKPEARSSSGASVPSPGKAKAAPPPKPTATCRDCEKGYEPGSGLEDGPGGGNALYCRSCLRVRCGRDPVTGKRLGSHESE